MDNNLLIMHGGGPTAVMNASLYGVVEEAKGHGEIGGILAAVGGTGGLLNESLLDLRSLPDDAVRSLPATPASAIGTSRDHLEPEDYERMARILKKRGIRYLLMNGGNGTMDTCGKLCAACGDGISIIGIPKTMDNDLAVTDHAPGFGSAARYIAASTMEVCADVRSLPIHIVVIEALGRNAGWVTAASALAAAGGFGPDLIYLPETAFDKDSFLSDAERLIKSKGHGVIVASEGLHYRDGSPIVEPVFKEGRSVYFGDVSAHLAGLITRELGYKSRSEKPGLMGRASIAHQSALDRQEAEQAGRDAVLAAIAGESGKMVAIRRLSSSPYRAETFLVDIAAVMLEEKKMPKGFINADKNGVTDEFISWCQPLIGGPLPVYSRLY